MVSCTHFPFELWHLVIDLACTDDGTTARSLNETSRMLRELSKPFRYTTITLVHEKQIIAFEDHISRISSEVPLIKNLFVSLSSNVGVQEQILSIHNALCLPLDHLLPYLPTLRDLALFRRLWYPSISDHPRLDPIAEGTGQFPVLEHLHLEGWTERASNQTQLERLAPVLKRFYVSKTIFWCHLTDPPDFPVSLEELVIPVVGQNEGADGSEQSFIWGWSGKEKSAWQ